MALQIRRGLEAGRAAVTPAPGELLYTTDQSKLYIGDGATGGGILITGSGIGNIIEDTTPQLGGNLDVTGYSIVTASNGNVIINPNGSGSILLQSTTVIGSDSTGQDGNVFITRNTYSATTGQGFTFAQHHETTDAVNFTFVRTRGTGLVPSTVVNGDDLAELAFVGQAGSQGATAAQISIVVEGTPTATRVPSKFRFLTDDGTGLGTRAELSAAGIWKVNSIQNLSGTELTVTAATVNIAGNVQINARGDLRFADTDSSNWVAFQAAATVAANVTWTLPSADGTVGQVLTTNGGGTLSWSTASGGGSGLVSRSSLTPATTAALASGASENLIITGYKGYVLYKIETSSAAWVRLYSSTAARDADASRLEGTDPLPGTGVIAEIISTGSQTILITPGAIGFNTELTPSAQIPCTITNKTGGTTTITVTLTVLQIEV